MCKELGFDTSFETFLRGEHSISIIFQIKTNYLLLIFFEMNPLKVEFFDCDQYMSTIDDLIQTLLEVLDSVGDY